MRAIKQSLIVHFQRLQSYFMFERSLKSVLDLSRKCLHFLMPSPISAACEQSRVERLSQTSLSSGMFLYLQYWGFFTQCIYCSLSEVTINTLRGKHCKLSFSTTRNKDASLISSLRTSCPLVSFCYLWDQHQLNDVYCANDMHFNAPWLYSDFFLYVSVGKD